VQEPKTAAGRHTVRLAASVLDALRVHRKHQLEQRLAAGADWQNTGYIFTTGIGTHLDPSAPGRDLDRLLAKAGLEHIRFHDLRHSAATFLLVLHTHANETADMLVHIAVQLTLFVYSYLSPNILTQAFHKIYGLLAEHD